MKTFIFLSLISFVASSAILKRPGYVPDENHPAPNRTQQMTPRQAEEERPQQLRDDWKEKRTEREKRERTIHRRKK